MVKWVQPEHCNPMRTKIVIQLRRFHGIKSYMQLWAIRPKRRSPRRPGWNRRAAAQRTSSATSEVPVPVSPFYQLYQLYALWRICYFFLTKRKHPYSVFHVHPYLRWQIPRIPPRLNAHYSTRCAQTWHQTQAMAKSEDQRRKEAGKLWGIMKMVKSCQIQIMMRIHTDGTSQKYQIRSLAWHDDVLNTELDWSLFLACIQYLFTHEHLVTPLKATNNVKESLSLSCEIKSSKGWCPQCDHFTWSEMRAITLQQRHTEAAVRPQHTVRSSDAWALPGMQGTRTHWKNTPKSSKENWSRNWVRRRHAAPHMRARLENPNYTAICNLPLFCWWCHTNELEHAAKVGRNYHKAWRWNLLPHA